MLRLLFRTLLVLSLGLFLALPAAAERKISSAEQEECDNEILECVVACTFLEDDAQFWICNNDCNDNFGICTRGDGVASTGGAAGQAGQSTAGVLGTPNPGSPHATAVGAIGEAEVERACKRVSGVFGRMSNAFGCINDSCEKGNCSLVCYGGKCFALTPDPLPERLTLLGILQNGDMVSRDPQGTPAGQSLSSPGGDPGATTSGGTKPHSGFDPGQTIF
jgi:hypothetical protein